MSVTSLPRVTAQLLAAQGLVSAEPWRILIVGQIGTGGATAVSGQYYEDVESLTNTEIETLFGARSELTGRIKRARSIILGRSAIGVIALDPDVGTSAATLDIVTAGTATEDGILTFKVIDEEEYTINVDVLSGDADTAVAANIKAAIDALDTLPATAGAVAIATVPLTAADGGTIPNKFVVKVTTEVAGLTVTAGQFTGGATDPSTTNIFDNVTAVRFHGISWPWDNDFSEVKSFLEGRNIINNEFLHGVAFIGLDDTESNISNKLNGATPENSPNLVFMGNRVVAGEAFIVTPPDWRVAEFIAIQAMRQTDGVPISQYVTTAAPLDVIGGSNLASLAYYNTPLALTDIADPNSLFTGQEQVNLKNDGYTIVGVNTSKTSAIMAEVVTTYKFNSLGNPDESFKYLNYVDTGYLALEIFFSTLKANNSQSRLTEGDLIENAAIQNEASIRAQYLDIYQRLSGPEFILTQSGREAIEFFEQNLSIDLDLATGTVTSSGQLPIVTQIRDFIISFQISFTIGG